MNADEPTHWGEQLPDELNAALFPTVPCALISGGQIKSALSTVRPRRTEADRKIRRPFIVFSSQ
jgi:hypothetical protein